MPFGLKNIWVTYEKLINTIFKDFIDTKVEAYIEDMVVKTSSHLNHLIELQYVFKGFLNII